MEMNIVFNNPLVHHILLREVHVENSNAEFMYFDLNGHTVKFSKDEFLFVIGLWRSPVIVPRTAELTSALRTKYVHNLRGTEIHQLPLKSITRGFSLRLT